MNRLKILRNKSGQHNSAACIGITVDLLYCHIYRGADKPLARPGRKHARATEDFDVHISYLLS